jgi:hypothetical protein
MLVRVEHPHKDTKTIYNKGNGMRRSFGDRRASCGGICTCTRSSSNGKSNGTTSTTAVCAPSARWRPIISCMKLFAPAAIVVISVIYIILQIRRTSELQQVTNTGLTSLLALLNYLASKLGM